MKPCNPISVLNKQHNLTLNCSMASPSLIHTEAIATEWIRNFMLSKLPNYFETVYINEKHILDEYKHMDKSYNFLSKPKPALAIIPKINYDFNNNDHNDNRFGNNIVINQSRLDTSFFKDFKKNRFLALALELVEIEYGMRILVDTRSKQVDLYKTMCNTFPIGTTAQIKIDLDFHIPLNMMIQLAKDSGYDIEHDDVAQCTQFVSYLNSKSELPIMYKYRRMTGKHEFFVRMRDFRLRVDMSERLNLDDGQQDGSTVDRFGIDFAMRVMIPSPKWFAYYSDQIHDKIQELPENKNENINIGVVDIHKIPNVNECGWNIYLTVDYEEVDKDKDVVINYTELFESLRMLELIKYALDNNINPTQFIDIKTYNGDKEYDLNMNWYTLEGSYYAKFKATTTVIALYLDTELVHKYNVEREKLNDNRIVNKH